MTTSELTKAIINRLKRFRYLILIVAVIFGVLLYLYAKNSPVTLTSKATVFPLSNTGESNSASSLSSLLLGTNSESKSFSDDASISIVELALSRRTREAVAAIVEPSMGNKTIAQLVIDDFNDHRGTFEEKISPRNTTELMNTAESMLKDGLVATINKNNILVLNYTGRSEDLVREISYRFIEKISSFYIDLKREKADRDFEFATSKVDSLKRVMGAKDYQLIGLDKRLLFTNTAKLQFRVPTENLLAEKQLIRNQYVQAVTNQQNAAYKLQKATPLIEVLDRPEPPYDFQKKSSKMYAIVGLVIGSILIIGLLVLNLLGIFIKQEISKLLSGLTGPKAVSATTSTSA